MNHQPDQSQRIAPLLVTHVGGPNDAQPGGGGDDEGPEDLGDQQVGAPLAHVLHAVQRRRLGVLQQRLGQVLLCDQT